MFSFVLVVSSRDRATGAWSQTTVRGTEPGRTTLDGRRVPAIQSDPARPDSATWGTFHPGHPASTWNPWLDEPLFSYGGMWYADLDAWATAWNATITDRGTM